MSQTHPHLNLLFAKSWQICRSIFYKPQHTLTASIGIRRVSSSQVLLSWINNAGLKEEEEKKRAFVYVTVKLSACITLTSWHSFHKAKGLSHYVHSAMLKRTGIIVIAVNIFKIPLWILRVAVLLKARDARSSHEAEIPNSVWLKFI